MSDFIRLFVVNEEGGYYLDADSFVVDARLHAAFAACPFAMFSSVTEAPYHHHMNNIAAAQLGQLRFSQPNPANPTQPNPTPNGPRDPLSMHLGKSLEPLA